MNINSLLSSEKSKPKPISSPTDINKSLYCTKDTPQPENNYIPQNLQQHSPNSYSSNSGGFIERVSNSIPIVNKSINNIHYYTPQLIHSSVQTVSTALPLNTLDRFACSGLDRLGLFQQQPQEEHIEISSSPVESDYPKISNTSSASLIPFSDYSISKVSNEDKPMDPPSRWSGVVTSVQYNFGQMVISDEVLKGIKYCIQWIQNAYHHIDEQVRTLRSYLEESYTRYSNQQHEPNFQRNEIIQAEHSLLLEKIFYVKREVVETVRKVVEIISRYAAVYLPGDAKQSVRNFILSLPSRWASSNTSQQSQQSSHPSPPETLQTPTPPLSPLAHANKVISFGQESSDMLKGVNNVFSQTLESAENILGRKVQVFRHNEDKMDLS
ncbi:hypothetical protein HDU92_001389 [Lobulomyces angularis]|nr:hypothetical protein HDU92_001389 [Lobulomyces angularis]